MKTRLKNERGFSLTEVILTLVVGTLLAGASSQTMVNSMTSYASIANRRATVSDSRYAMNQVTYELRGLSTAKIKSINSTEIYFTDSTGSDSSFHLATNGSNLALFRGSEVLLDKVESFSIDYYNDQGQEIAATAENIPNIRRIKVDITASPISKEGAITLSTIITPRQFIGFANYQYQ